ncbi:hypothetical protein TNCV_831151 [Trichonephila clavipes]|nr:hypothetical protein TNCV_831151 [Trichonephila clavipes]
MENLSGQSFIPTNLGRVDEEMIPPGREVSLVLFTAKDFTSYGILLDTISGVTYTPHRGVGRVLGGPKPNCHQVPFVKSNLGAQMFYVMPKDTILRIFCGSKGVTLIT